MVTDALPECTQRCPSHARRRHTGELTVRPDVTQSYRLRTQARVPWFANLSVGAPRQAASGLPSPTAASGLVRRPPAAAAGRPRVTSNPTASLLRTPYATAPAVLRSLWLWSFAHITLPCDTPCASGAVSPPRRHGSDSVPSSECFSDTWSDIHKNLSHIYHCNKTKFLDFFGGEGGIRTLGTLLTYTHFPGVLLKPLGHLSGWRKG